MQWAADIWEDTDRIMCSAGGHWSGLVRPCWDALGKRPPAPSDRWRNEYADHGFAAHCQMVPLKLCPQPAQDWKHSQTENRQRIQNGQFLRCFLPASSHMNSSEGRGGRGGRQNSCFWTSSSSRLVSAWLGNGWANWEFHAAVDFPHLNGLPESSPRLDDSNDRQSGAGSDVSSWCC